MSTTGAIKRKISSISNSSSTKSYTPFAQAFSNRLAGRKILFVGGGNLSYELSFARKHPELTSEMVATTYESPDEFECNSTSVNNKKALLSLGVKVYHKIDATRLHALNFFKQMDPKQIYFCHPHSGEFDSTPALLEAFIHSVDCSHAKKNCSIHIIRVRGGDYELSKPEAEREFHYSKDEYDFIEHYRNLYGFADIHLSGFKLTAKHRFKERRYPGYIHIKTNDDLNSASMVGRNNSLEYVFKRTTTQDDDSSDEYNSEDIESDSESEAELVIKTKRRPSFKR